MPDTVARGANFLYGKEYVVDTYGDEFWHRVLDRLTAEHAAVWKGAVTPVGTYSFPAFKGMTEAVAAEAGHQDDRELARMYEFIADRSLNALYKVFFRMANPAYVIGNYPKLWTRFFTVGTVSVPEKAAGMARVVFRLPEMFLDWIGPACLGYSAKAVSMAGGRDVSVTERARAHQPDGTWEVVFDLRWKE